MANKRKYAAMARVGASAYKRVRKSYNNYRKSVANKYAAKSGANTTTVQKDVAYTKHKKSNKRLLLKQKNYRKKIQKALEPIATHHTYNEVQATASTVTKVGVLNPIQEQYFNNSSAQIFGLNYGS